jgi:hypothetical protein
VEADADQDRADGGQPIDVVGKVLRALIGDEVVEDETRQAQHAIGGPRKGSRARQKRAIRGRTKATWPRRREINRLGHSAEPDFATGVVARRKAPAGEVEHASLGSSDLGGCVGNRHPEGSESHGRRVEGMVDGCTAR